ncbi:dephospho-CoA kinase [Actinomycetospora cinnamomea]|uniref:Dephospho-CoA kinase n=1 Tax=Actinomycetospora cinnamomea TaxID=663609 RepID=A0A2U1FIF6_9PSEU|nr:dephospho-CoA kinase [Actinomycetospora cinnamomea]PVZ11948.1 dephospho-CoA kinase [Actinomycetospora cinnamomea]
MLRLGLTGGIGAGKSTVAETLTDLGAVVIDADRIAREVVEPGTEGLAEVVAAFGEGVLDAEGGLDRPALGRIVFGDDARRQQLNGILHPRIGARTAELVAEAPDDAVIVHDVPLLVENGMGAAFALVIVVDAPVGVRVTRLADTRGMSVEDARARMAAQADDEARRAAADVWLDNAGAAGALREQVERLWNERLVPFAQNVEHGWAVPAPTEVVAPADDRELVGRRLAARLAVAGGESVRRVEHVGAGAVPGLPAPDVVDLLVEADRPGKELAEALAAAGFPATGPGRHGSADPARPARVLVLDAKDRRQAKRARSILQSRDLARADPGRVASDPAAVRAELALD